MKKALITIAALAIIGMAAQALALDSFKFYRNKAGDQTFAITQGYVNNYVLTPDANKAVTVPTGARYAVFAATADIWVTIGGVAAIPAGDVTDGTGSEFNPVVRWTEGQTTIGVISASAAKVSITFYE